jgi:hypothetical protein
MRPPPGPAKRDHSSLRLADAMVMARVFCFGRVTMAW